MFSVRCVKLSSGVTDFDMVELIRLDDSRMELRKPEDRIGL